MNKNDLIVQVAKSAGLTKVAATEVVNSIFDSVVNSLKAGDDVRITGFGSFTVAQRNERIGRNPSTGAKIAVAAKKSIRFSATPAMKSSPLTGTCPHCRAGAIPHRTPSGSGASGRRYQRRSFRLR